ncbi:hypothetical protein C8Q77DRAFT_1049757 [Trametes polyzona]|nr:hypothetical protein C8Q77DRAFT_1049757 [Trametes polyzona]
MEKLATELLVAIFTLSCTDGGYIACSLALVCRHFREVVRPLRFHSVFLTGDPKKLQAFSNQLEEERAACGPGAAKVRHMFLNIQDVGYRQDFHPSPVTEDEHDSVDPGLGFDDRRDLRKRAQYTSIVSSILRAVAPTLITLVFIPYSYAAPLDPSIVFPRLREFALATPPVDDRLGPVNDPETTLRYPSLTRLHLLSGSFGWQGIEYWAQNAPGLTHIRISAISYWERGEGIAVVHGYTEESGLISKPPLVGLRRLLLQLNLPPPVRYCHGQPLVRYKRMVPLLWTSQAKTSIPVYIVPPPENEHPETGWTQHAGYEKTLGEWEERMQGGTGCWDVAEEYARSRFGDGDGPPAYLTPWLKRKVPKVCH